MAFSLRDRWEENRRRRSAGVPEIPRTVEELPVPLESEIALLDEWASRCELWSAGEKYQVGDREKPRLLARADRYRDLQIVAMSKPWAMEKELWERMHRIL